MTEVEPQKVTALRGLVASRLGLEIEAVGVRERRLPGSDQDEPDYLTLVVEAQTLDDETIQAAVHAAQDLMPQHPGYHVSLLWERKPPEPAP